MKTFNRNLLKLVALLLFVSATSFAATQIHVKREGSSEAPQVHIWTYNGSSDVALTDTSNWPNNLPVVTTEGNDWFSYSFNDSVFGCLFVYDDIQTEDFKYYSTNRWIVLNADGSLKSVSEVNPETINDLIITESIEPKDNGKYNEGDIVLVTLTSPGNKEIYYTTDGSDPSAVIGTINGTLYTEPIEITTNTTLKASLAGGYYVGYPILGTPEIKEYEFEEVIIIPTFTYSTNPGLSDNGTYPEGTTVEVTFNLSNSSNDPDWDIYYSLDGNDVDLSQINGGGYLNPIRYAGTFNITSDVVVYAKLFNVVTGHNQSVSPMVFTFEVPTPQQTIYVKKENTLNPPKIHVWREDGAATITNPSDWPNNLPLMTYNHESSDGWYSYTFDKVPSYGTLFYLGNTKTDDFSFYSEDRYFLFDEDNNLVSNTTTKPQTEEIVLEISVDNEPNTNGKYNFGEVVTVFFTSNGGFDNRYIAYTTDGTDPATSSTFTQLNKTEGYPTSIQISSNTQLRAIEEQLYRSNPRSNEISLNFEFEDELSYKVTFTENKSPKPNGKYNLGDTIEVSLFNTNNLNIYFTTDGTDPAGTVGHTNGTLYTSPISVSETTVIKAAVDRGEFEGRLFPELGIPTVKTYEFEPFEEVPSFTYSTNPGLSDNGTYPTGTTVSTTFSLNYPSDNPNWIIYYSLDGNEVNLDNVNTNSQNAILYTGAFEITNDIVVYAKMYNTNTGQNQGVSPMIYSFEEPIQEYTIYVKKQGGNAPPKIHVWSNPDVEERESLTDSSAWPSNLSSMTYTYDDGWYQFSASDIESYGTLFVFDYDDTSGAYDQTDDYKFYSEDRYFLFDENNNLVSNTVYKPFNIEMSISNDIAPNNEGNYIEGQTVTVTFNSNGGFYKRYLAYTTDGSDPKTSDTYQLIVITQYTPATLEITKNTTLRAIEENIYRGGPYSNEVSFDYNFIPPPTYLSYSTDVEPTNGDLFLTGQRVNVSISRSIGCGGCSFAVYYTTDGSEPSESETKTLYTEAFEITENTTIKAAIHSYMGDEWYPTETTTISFDPTEALVPVVTRSTSHELDNLGQYPKGETVTVELLQNDPEVNKNWELYYTLNWQPVDLNNIGTGSDNTILYTGSFDITSDILVYAKLVHTITGQKVDVIGLKFEFSPGEEYTLFVKRYGHDYSPRTHVWSKETGVDVAITNPANWPNYLDYQLTKIGDWFTYTLTKEQAGILYIYNDGYQTPDFKYYSEDTYILLAENGELISITSTEPTDSQSRPNTTVGTPNEGLRLSPNPTNSTFILNYSNGKTEASEIAIYDFSGKQLYAESLPEASFIIKEYNVGNLGLHAGTYIVTVTTATSNEIKRLVVK